MKLSVSLSEQDVQVLDAYARDQGLPSRSAALQRAIALLRHPQLEREYAQAWEDWTGSSDETAWDDTVGDGLRDATR